MDKVIIDGVDASGCKYWSGSKLGYCNIGLWANDGTHICECEYNCYYKQLKRKEQFLKEIEKEITTYRLKYDTTHTASKLLDSLASKIRKELYE